MMISPLGRKCVSANARSLYSLRSADIFSMIAMSHTPAQHEARRDFSTRAEAPGFRSGRAGAIPRMTRAVARPLSALSSITPLLKMMRHRADLSASPTTFIASLRRLPRLCQSWRHLAEYSHGRVDFSMLFDRALFSEPAEAQLRAIDDARACRRFSPARSELSLGP